MVRVGLWVFMIPTEFWVALATFFGTTLAIVMYLRISGTKLETRVNRIIEEKKQIISESYLELIEKTIEGFKTQRLLSQKQEERLEEISYARFQLNYLPNRISKVVDKLSFSLVFGIASVVFMIMFAYIPIMDFEPTFSFWLQMIVGALLIISVQRYLFDGVVKIYPLRKFEKLVNEIERSNRFEQVYELL